MSKPRIDKVFCIEKDRDIIFSERRLTEMGRPGYLKTKEIICLEKDKLKCRTSPSCPVAKMRKISVRKTG